MLDKSGCRSGRSVREKKKKKKSGGGGGCLVGWFVWYKIQTLHHNLITNKVTIPVKVVLAAGCI